MHVTGTQTVTHEYLTLNGKVARETIRTNNTLTAVLDFIYDESGKPFALKYSTNGTSFKTYYYVLNLQGDVVKLIHYIPGFEYESVATYEYDAWGNIVSSSGRLAEINPLRYRGYYYDSETGFYYLQSRYYDPANRRFISADSYQSTGQGFVGTNMFAYCNNSPVFLVDSYGNMAGKSHLVYSSEGGSRYRNAQNDGEGARSAELEEYLNGYLLPYDSYASTGQGFLGVNMFAYCNNLPVIVHDSNGEFSSQLIVIPIVIIAGLLGGCESEMEKKWPKEGHYKYKPRGSSSIDDNCYSYAFDYNGVCDPGDSSGVSSRLDDAGGEPHYNLGSIKEGVLADAAVRGKNVKYLPNEYINYKIPDRAYLIACKISSDATDYHFAVMLSDGIWIDKPGIGETRYGAIDGFANTWTIGDITYAGDTMYFLYTP